MTAPASLEAFYQAAEPYVSLFDTFASKYPLIDYVVPDHICYKCGSRASFEKLRDIFEREGCWVFQSTISKRTIAYIRLKQPLKTVLGDINYLELADQKPDRTQRARFDHIEVYPSEWTYDNMIKHLSDAGERVLVNERPHHSTHEIDIGSGFKFSCTRERLVDKIKREEML